jgi:hypothetical protein
MSRDPSITALARCGEECRTASNGHGRRWAVERCVKALTATDTPPAIAASSAQAMARLAQQLAATPAAR